MWKGCAHAQGTVLFKLVRLPENYSSVQECAHTEHKQYFERFRQALFLMIKLTNFTFTWNMGEYMAHTLAPGLGVKDSTIFQPSSTNW